MFGKSFGFCLTKKIKTTMRLLKDGWIQEARRMHSPHYDSRPDARDISLLVVHGISLPRGEFGGNEVADFFCGKLNFNSRPVFSCLKGVRVSAHFFIRRNGAIMQFVSCENRAWHAGKSQWRGREQCNDFSLGAELEGADDIPYAAAQYDSLAELHFALSQKYAPLFAAGHEHIAPGRKTDPGAAFDWQKLFNKIGDKNDGRTP